MNKPQINVTPLIDVLLVLLIIFMVVAPLRPSAFKTRIPAEPKDPVTGPVHPQTLVVIVRPDLSVMLNKETGLGAVNEPEKLITRLRQVFEQRAADGDISSSFGDAPDPPGNDRIERMVFVKAPRSIDYGSVARVVDAVKTAGAFPISLQIDDLEGERF